MSSTTPAAADTRARILLEAAMLFADRGFDTPSVREICEAAGVSKPMLYYHFDSKSGLIAAVLTTLHDDFEALITELFNPAEATVAGCVAGYKRLFDRIEARSWTVRLWSRVPAMHQNGDCCAARKRTAETRMATYLRNIDALPPHTDVDAATWLLLASFGPITMHKELEPIPLSNAQLAERLVRQALGVPAAPSEALS